MQGPEQSRPGGPWAVKWEGESSNYWSATTNANNTDNAWNMNFNNGNDNNNNKSNSYYARAVRSGKCSLLSFESIYNAYLDCRKRKRGTINAVRFEYNLLENLFQLASDLQKGTYRPSRSVYFITRSPKLREIFAADFRDRVVHHLLVRELEKTWVPRFIADSYASIKTKGIHGAVERLQRFMRKATRNRKRAAYFIKLDVRSFFMSIDKAILFAIFEQAGTPEALLYIPHTVIFHDPTKDYYFRGDRGMLDNIPPHKSLFKVGAGKGLPIGNLTSQFFANVYLDRLDQFVKHELRCRFYIRYVDDFILVSPDPQQLLEWRDRIEWFLQEKLALELKDPGKEARVSEGADFLGYIVRPAYSLVRRRVVHNLKYKIALFRDRIVENFQYDGEDYCRMVFDPDQATALRQTIASYMGHFKHADARRLTGAFFHRHGWLHQLFIVENGKLKDRYRTGKLFKSMRLQVNFFRIRYPGYVLFFQVGKYTELYDHEADLAVRLLKCQPQKWIRGIGTGAGFPNRILPIYLRRFLGAGYRVAVIVQGDPGRWVRQRYVSQIYLQQGVVPSMKGEDVS